MILPLTLREDFFLNVCVFVLMNPPLTRIKKEAVHFINNRFSHCSSSKRECFFYFFTGPILLATQSEITVHLTMSKPIETHCYLLSFVQILMHF